MEIGFIYPDLDMDSYVDSIDSFNFDISQENLKTLLPRLTLFIVKLLVYVVWLLIVRVLFLKITWAVTAKGAGVIIPSLMGFLVLILVSLQLISYLRKKFRPHLLKLLRGEEAKESFSMSAYVERKDGSKLVRQEVGFYKMCDTLKRSKIVDATAVCDGKECKVEVQYENNGDSSVFTFYLSYHDSDVDHVIVDLNRRCVIFPKEVIKNENDE